MGNRNTTAESEKTIETNLRTAVDRAGGWCLKLPAVHITGLPDRIALMPGGRVFFAEIKTTGKKRTKIQKYVCGKIEALGFEVFVIDRTCDIPTIIAKYE